MAQRDGVPADGVRHAIRPLSEDDAAKQIEQWRDDWPASVTFALRAIDDDRLVGMTRLYDIQSHHRTAVLGLGIGRESEWGKGFGTDASKVTIRYGFQELNLYRIWLDVFGYNERAQALYRKLGFTEEGRLREHFERNGRRHDVILMGLPPPGMGAHRVAAIRARLGPRDRPASWARVRRGRVGRAFPTSATRAATTLAARWRRRVRFRSGRSPSGAGTRTRRCSGSTGSSGCGSRWRGRRRRRRSTTSPG